MRNVCRRLAANTPGGDVTTRFPRSRPGAVPKFKANDLASTAGKNWPTVGGSVANDRYSTLDEIHDGNVGDLKGMWHTNLADSGTAAKYSGESQPVIYNGALYVTTGAND